MKNLASLETTEPTPKPKEREAANHVRGSIVGMARKLRGLRADHGVSGARLSLLGILHRHGQPLTATDLARLERLQPQSLTRIIADLDAQGLIERHQNEADRRQTHIAISARGSELLFADAHRQNTWLAHVMATKLTAAERDVLRIASDLLNTLALEGSLRGRTERQY